MGVSGRPPGETVTVAELADAVDIDELRDLLGATTRRRERAARSYAQYVAGRKGFPEPIVDHPRLRLWLRREVLAWITANR